MRATDILSTGKYPANKLSNFAANGFVLDGVQCNSMEGFLQSLKFKNPDMQKQICLLVGIGAKKAGRNKNWRKKQELYWQGKIYPRKSDAYQRLLDRAYNALSENESFKKALIASGTAVFTHANGSHKESETVLTSREFCSRLTAIRERYNKEKDEARKC